MGKHNATAKGGRLTIPLSKRDIRMLRREQSRPLQQQLQQQQRIQKMMAKKLDAFGKLAMQLSEVAGIDNAERHGRLSALAELGEERRRRFELEARLAEEQARLAEEQRRRRQLEATLAEHVRQRSAAQDTAAGLAAELARERQARLAAEAARNDLAEDVEELGTTITQQLLATDVWQRRFDELASAVAQGQVDLAALISQIRVRPLTSGR